MFIVIADVTLKSNQESDFAKWFSESNKTISKFPGFVSRRLLQSQDGTHRIVVEFENKDDFEKMHHSEEHMKLHSQAVTFMESPPSPKFYSIMAS